MVFTLAAREAQKRVNDCNVVFQALLAAADFLEVRAVRDFCCAYMERHLDVNNCLELYLCADLYACGALKKRCMDFILEYFPVLYKVSH